MNDYFSEVEPCLPLCLWRDWGFFSPGCCPVCGDPDPAQCLTVPTAQRVRGDSRRPPNPDRFAIPTGSEMRPVGEVG
jgi:hypothetical protein